MALLDFLGMPLRKWIGEPEPTHKKLEDGYKKDLPDLPDYLLLAETRAILADCHPFGRVPSSARMRRVLRAAVKLLEEKLSDEDKPGD